MHCRILIHLTSIVLSLFLSGPVLGQDKGQPSKENKSPLDRLSRGELTPLEKQELPAETVAVIRGGGAAMIRSCAFTPDGSRLAIGRENGDIELWDLTAAKPKRQAVLENKGAVARLVFSSDGTRMASLHG